MRCYLTVVSVCIILMISYDQHLFMCLLTVSLCKNVYEGPLSIYKNKSDCCFAMEWYGFHVYLDMNPFSGKWFAKVFSQPQAVFFHFVHCLLCRSFQFDVVLIVYFGFCFPCFWCQIQSNQCRDQCQDFPPMSISRNFMVSNFIFNSLVYFKLNFCKFYKMSIQFHS